MAKEHRDYASEIAALLEFDPNDTVRVMIDRMLDSIAEIKALRLSVETIKEKLNAVEHTESCVYNVVDMVAMCDRILAMEEIDVDDEARNNNTTEEGNDE